MEGEALRQWRERQGWTLTQLAQAFDVKPSTILRWEREDRHPPGNLLERALRDLDRELAEGRGRIEGGEGDAG